MGKMWLGPKSDLQSKARSENKAITLRNDQEDKAMTLQEPLMIVNEVVKYIDRPIEVVKEVEKIVYVDRPIEIIKIKHVDRPIEVIKTVEVEKIVEVIKHVDKPIVTLVPQIKVHYKAPKWAWMLLGIAILELAAILQLMAV